MGLDDRYPIFGWILMLTDQMGMHFPIRIIDPDLMMP